MIGRGDRTPQPGSKPWTDAQRAESIQRDLTALTDERMAAWHRREIALQAKVSAMEQMHAAHAAAERSVEDIDNLTAQIEEQVTALAELLPQQRRPADG